MFFPWSEMRSLRYYKDDKCNLQTAYQLLKIGDVEGAAEQSKKNLEYCKSQPKIKPKTLARAYYNLGMSHFMRDEHDEALELFEQAYRLKSGSRIQETILECKRAKAEAAKMREYESRMALAETNKSASIAHPAAGKVEEAAEGTIGDRLRQLEDLRRQGLVSDEEYELKKKEILADL
jgi:tetratricopeptide (TPR) repeat protein